MFNAAFTHCQLLAFAVIAQIDCLSKLFRHCEPSLHNYQSAQHSRYPQSTKCLERFLGRISRDPSVSKSKRLHVHIIWFVSINLRCIL
jgi:hypothetical protein